MGHYSTRTEEAYVHWVSRFVRHHGLRHPREMGEAEVAEYLRHLAEDKHVAAATQTQALSALLFLYREVLGRRLTLPGIILRARTPTRIPVVLTRGEVERVLAQLTGSYRLVGLLLYGSGLRLMECLTLRVKDLDPERGEIRLRYLARALSRQSDQPGSQNGSQRDGVLGRTRDMGCHSRARGRSGILPLLPVRGRLTSACC